MTRIGAICSDARAAAVFPLICDEVKPLQKKSPRFWRGLSDHAADAISATGKHSSKLRIQLFDL
jgi:hypothetical protein